jgi:Domain of unknown function (DUF4336)
MEPLAENIWTHEDTMQLGGAPLRLRMTIVKLEDNSLWVHSPTALSESLKEQVAALGEVSCIVAASNGHNIWVREWQLAYPQATLFVSGKIPQKLNLTRYQLLDNAFDNPWKNDFEREYMVGVPFFNESVFLHKSSQSLIVTDLIQNHSDPRPEGLAGFMTRFVFEPLGFKGMCMAPPLKLSFMIKNKDAFHEFVNRVNEWDFKRIIVTHGDIIEQNSKQIFSDICDRFL